MSATDIEISVSHSDAASKTLSITVPVEKIEATEAETLRWYSTQVRLPGFRKGKAPAPVVKRRYADAIRQSVLEDLVRQSWQKAREEQNIRPLGEPEVRITKFEPNEPLSFEIRVDVKPEIKLDRLGGFRLTRQAQPVTDEMIDSQLLQMREQKAPWVPAEGRAKPGDLVEASITNLDTQEEAGEPVRFILGQGRALPELEEQMMQMDPGGTWEGSVRFPDTHADESKRGQSRRVKVELKEVKRQQLPELNDEFAREMSASFENVQQLKDAIRADLTAEAGREADARVRSELVDQLAAANNVAVPPSLLDRALHAYLHAYGVPHEQEQRFHQEFRPVAEAQVRRDLIIDAVATQHNLAATKEELEQRIAEIAARRGENAGSVRAQLEKANRLRELERGITDEKVFDYLLKQSTID